MFGAIGRWFKALGYFITGQIDAARRVLDTDPHVVRAKYDGIIRDKTGRIQQYKQAVAQLIAQEETKMAKVKTLTADMGKLERLKAGALAKAKERVKLLTGQGKSQAEVKNDEEYMKCLTAYNDFSSTLTEKQSRIEELENDINEYSSRISEHKIQLQGLLRDLEKIKSEQADAVADMITSQQEKELNDALSGIAEDGTAEELQRMRQLRQEVKAEARISKELASTDGAVQEAEFMEYARSTEANDEFEALVGLAEEKDVAPDTSVPPEPEKDTSLPE